MDQFKGHIVPWLLMCALNAVMTDKQNGVLKVCEYM